MNELCNAKLVSLYDQTCGGWTGDWHLQHLLIFSSHACQPAKSSGKVNNLQIKTLHYSASCDVWMSDSLMPPISITIPCCNYCYCSELNQSQSVRLARVSSSSSGWKQTSVCLPEINTHLLMKQTRALLFKILVEILITRVSVMMSGLCTTACTCVATHTWTHTVIIKMKSWTCKWTVSILMPLVLNGLFVQITKKGKLKSNLSLTTGKM